MAEEPETAADRGGAQVTRRAGIVAAGTFASRILGAVRDAVIAAAFPAAATDVFFVAFTIPNALRSVVGEGAVSAAFVPVFTELDTKVGRARALEFHRHLSAAMLIVLLAITVAGTLGARPLTLLFASGYRLDPEKLELAVTLTRWTFPYIFFMGFAALGMGALNSVGKFAVPAFAPALLNVPMILAPLIFVGPAMALGLPPIGALAIGALIGGLLQAAAQEPALRAIGGSLTPTRGGFSDPDVRRAFRLMGPLVIAIGIYPLNLVLSREFASYLPDGSQSYLYYAQRLVDVPQGVFALAIGSAALPTLAALELRGDHEGTHLVFTRALRLALFVGIPATVLFIVLAEPTVTMIFARGVFHATEMTGETAKNLAVQSIGLVCVAALRVVVPRFHSTNDTKSPVVGSAVNLVVFVALSLALMPRFEHLGIACAISAASIAQLIVMLLLLRRRVGPLRLGGVVASACRATVAAAAMGACAYAIARFGDWSRGGNDVRNISVFAGAVAAAGASYLLVARLVGSEEIGELSAAIRRRRTS